MKLNKNDDFFGIKLMRKYTLNHTEITNIFDTKAGLNHCTTGNL